MKTVTFVLLAIAVASLAGACSKGSETQSTPPRASSPPAPAPASQAPAPQAAARPARDACALLSAAEATEITGLPIERVEKTGDGCAWYASAAAQREKGAADVAGMLQQMTKREAGSAEEATKNVESVMKGLIGAAGPKGPLFAVTVQSENADQAEAILKGTIAAVGAGAPGGKLEPAEGLGDRAYWGPVASFLVVRKGPVLLNLSLQTFSGSREQALALARRMVSRL